MTLAIIGIIAALAAAGVAIPGISSALGKKAGESASSNSGFGSKVSDFFGGLWDKIKGFFKKGADSPANTSTNAATGKEDQLYSPNPVINQGDQSSAEANANTEQSIASSVTQAQQTADGGSAQQNDNQYDYIRQLFAVLGLSQMLSGQSNKYDWNQDYDDIVNDERKYGQGAIADARRWAEYMDNTRYQRAVKDIEAAGLNPWLALNGGSMSPGTTPSIETGSALGSISTSLSQSISQGNSNSSSAIIVALIAMLAKFLA